MKTFHGIVLKGKRRGHALGYPTLNIPLLDEGVAAVYAARVHVGGADPSLAAAFADPKRKILEAHLLDFDADLYGKEIRIDLVAKIRDSARFESDDALKAAIAGDIAKVREYFKN